MMKFLAVILSVYILFLTVIPCVDTPMDNCMHQTYLSHNSDNQKQSDIDLCSPFCTCNCCNTPVSFTAGILDVKCLVFIQNQQSEFTPANPISTIVSIWQPPKIG